MRYTAAFPRHDSDFPLLLPTPERLGALETYTGRGVTVAFLDSGFYMHPDLGDRIRLHVDATTHHILEQPRVLEVNDLSWHGQMTSVVAAGDGFSSGGRYRGIASGCQLVLVKISSPRWQVKEADILRGLRWLIDTHERLNVRVVNMSVGGDYFSDDPDHPLHQAVRKLVESGVTVVAASGNHSAGSLVPPASSAEAITVGGYNDNNSLDRSRWGMYQSDYGYAYDGTSKPDVIAPAQWIASPILPGTLVDREAYWLGPLLSSEGEKAMRRLLVSGYADLGLRRHEVERPDDALYARLQARINSLKLIDAKHQHVDGTSVSAAIVTSVVAQMLEANPCLTPDVIRSILMETAQPVAHIPPERQGAGAINPRAAVTKVLQLQKPNGKQRTLLRNS